MNFGRKLFWAALSCAVSFAADWQPITPAELSQKDSLVEKGADAEMLLLETRLSNELQNRIPVVIRSQYVRIKIFNERGRDQWSTVNLAMPGNMRIIGLMGRTIHPDGSIIALENSAIFDRAPDKNGSNAQKVKHKSFTMPAVEPGSIIEYRWNEETERRFSLYERLDFQTGIPIQTVRFLIKPYRASGFDFEMFLQYFNCPTPDPERDINGFRRVTLNNIPAFRAEPNMPPENEVRGWILVYYRRKEKLDTAEFWKDYGRKLYGDYKPHMKVSADVKNKSAEIVAKGTTPDEKLLLLVDFCKTQIKNAQSEAVSAEERADLQANKTPDDTLSQGVGKPDEIRELFGALATAAGFEARMAAVPRRDVFFFNKELAEPYFLNERAVVVNVNGNWRFYDPVTVGLPRDMLAWRHEGVEALISDPKDPQFVTTPVSPAEKTVARREGKFRLSEDGTLEGDIEAKYSGHAGAGWKERSQHESDAQREEAVKNSLKQHGSTAEFSNITIENMTDPDKPFIYRCHVRIPGYAQRTGKRLFFAPSFFQQGASAMYPLKDRKYPVYIRWSWVDEDKETFDLPAGFEAEAPQIPAAVPFGSLGRYEVKARIVDKKQLVFERRFIFGEHALLVPVQSYPALKRTLDLVAQDDQATFTLRMVEAAAKQE